MNWLAGSIAAACVCLASLVGAAACGDTAVPAETDATTAGSDAAAEVVNDATGTDAIGTADVAPAITIGKACAVKADCPGGLACMETNAATGDGICSQLCKNTSECPEHTFCNPIGKVQGCTLGSFCNACTVDSDCGAAAPICIPGKDGKTFCSAPCSFGDKTCHAGWSCEQYGSSISNFGCRPDYGSCTGGGEFCAPCQNQSDCKDGTSCVVSPDTGERACFQKCSAKDSCPQGFSCSPGGFCARFVADPDPKKAGSYVQTCESDNRLYCDQCGADWQCASGRCATVNGQAFCAEPSPCSKDNETKDCAPGTFCVPSDKGMVCAPPNSWKCQGFKACLGNPCGSNQTCDNGVCKNKP